jgi:hypothetical protein
MSESGDWIYAAEDDGPLAELRMATEHRVQ